MRPTSITNAEREKYAEIWEYEEYSRVSPGVYYSDLFFRMVKPTAGQSVLDVGAGGGAASRVLKDRGLSVKGFDITDVGWKHPDIQLMLGCIWRDLPVGSSPPFDYAYCCDVMEHLPTEFTALSASEIIRTCGLAFFSIAFHQEHYGYLVGKPLHLTVKKFEWWRDMMREVGTVHEARDLLDNGVFLVGR